MADGEDRLTDYYIEMTDSRLERIEAKLDDLLSFKWQIIGGSLVLSTFFSILISIGLAYVAK